MQKFWWKNYKWFVKIVTRVYLAKTLTISYCFIHYQAYIQNIVQTGEGAYSKENTTWANAKMVGETRRLNLTWICRTFSLTGQSTILSRVIICISISPLPRRITKFFAKGFPAYTPAHKAANWHLGLSTIDVLDARRLSLCNVHTFTILHAKT